MIEGFDNALDAFIERQEHIDYIKEKVKGINGEADAKLLEVDKKIQEIEGHISNRELIHLEELPPEAFKGYGGQTSQYDDDFEYGPTPEEDKQLHELFEERRKIIEKYVEISLY